MDDATTAQPLKCKDCGKDITNDNHFMCDQEPETVVRCQQCFPKCPCGMGEHGEECPTGVFVR